MHAHTFINRHAASIRPDPSRVIVRPFRPTIEPRNLQPTDKTRVKNVVERILSLGEDCERAQLMDILSHFHGRHRRLLSIFEDSADAMNEALAEHAPFSESQRRLIGAYFLHEYSFEGAALFNPSIVPHPDQTDVAPGHLRFVLSLRAVGEGHVSSLTFRTGIVSPTGGIVIDPAARLAALPRISERGGLQFGDDITLTFPTDEDVSERVIFPVTIAQSNGIEDARFVACVEDGKTVYRATFTAYSGTAIRSELIETTDFLTFRMRTLAGAATTGKGMALFPRKIDGRYAMISRQDNENLYLVYSDDLTVWERGEVVLRPKFHWEFVQIGNCGAPIELDEGWLLLTHGVGAVRRYSIGAALLDKSDPSKVLARSAAPLVRPEASEREGYVPNVVYTCGGLRHNGMIILPYAVSDTFVTFATMSIADLLGSLEPTE
jgi:predicted GH43/DUF377 family glycosyl hydrolase